MVEHQGDGPPGRGVVDALRRFDPRWLPTALRRRRPADAADAAGSAAIAARLGELIDFYVRERVRLHDEARRMAGGDRHAAERIVRRAVRRLCQDPPAPPGGIGDHVHATLRAEAVRERGDPLPDVPP